MKPSKLNFVKLNIKWLTIGILLLILGYTILGWSTASPKSNEEATFAWHKITLAPIIILLGYTSIGLAIMILPRK
jgi:uncharacterized membrane protein